MNRRMHCKYQQRPKMTFEIAKKVPGRGQQKASQSDCDMETWAK